MTAPRMLHTGTTYLVTRRCRDRRFRLTPDEEVTQLLDYLLGYSVFKTDVQVVAAVALSNHFHLVVHDPDARLPEFMQTLCSFGARALNAMQGEFGSFWEAGSYSAVRLETPDDVVDKIAYVIANPVAAGLVRKPELWPGLITLVDSLGRDTRKATKPADFFQRKGEPPKRPRGGKRKPLPEEAEWELAVPPGFEDAEDLRARVASVLEVRLERIHDERRKEGARPFLGVKAIRRQTIHDTPSSTEERFRTNPRLACRDWTRRAQLCEAWVAFQVAHRAALAEYRKGTPNVVFPAGTYLMRVHHRVRCSGGAAA